MAGAADWALTDAVRDRIYKRLFLPCAAALDALEQALWLHPQNDSYRAELIHGDEAATRFTGDPIIAVTACTPSTDCDAEGIIYGSLVDESPGAGQATVNFYNTQARGGAIVATGNAANGATIVIAPNAGYAFAGTLPIGAIGANEAFAFKITPPYYKLSELQFNGDEEDDGQNDSAVKAAADEARSSLLSAAEAHAGAAAAVFRSTFRRRLVSRSSETVLIAPGLTLEGAGQVTSSPSGLLVDNELAMAANSAGSGEMKAGAPTQGTSSALATGTLVTFSTITLGVRALLSILTLVCTKALDEDGDPQFDVYYDTTDTRRKPSDGQASVLLPNKLTLGKTWKNPEHGISALLVDYTPAITNSSGASLSATAADWIRPAGLTSALTDAGKLYTYYDIGNTRLEFYSTAAARTAQDADYLVTYATLAAAAVNTAFTTEDTGNGVILAGKSGAGTGALLVEGNTGTVDFQPPISQAPSSRASVTVTETVRRSLPLRVFSDGLIGGSPGDPDQTSGGYSLNTGAAPNILPGWIRAASLTQHKRVSNRRG